MILQTPKLALKQIAFALMVIVVAPSTVSASQPVSAVSFNIQFLGHFKNKQNHLLAELLEPFDLIFVQELVAPPFAGTYPNGVAYKADLEAQAFFIAMENAGFSYWLSEEDTGTGIRNHRATTATEWWVAFYRDDRIARAEDLPHGFLATDRSDHDDYERVPYAFAFRFDGTTDAVFISTHLKPGGSRSDARRRAVEINAIAKWIRDHSDEEKDFIILGDMNIKNCAELNAVTPQGFTSMNGECLPTNTSPRTPRPYDHVMYRPADSQNEFVGGTPSVVIDLVEASHSLWSGPEPFPGNPYAHNRFRTSLSDHHPIYFQIIPGADDD